MKIHIVVGNNRADDLDKYVEWVEAVFITKEAAREYIRKQPARWDQENARLDELEELEDIRQLTEDEKKERDRLINHWDNCGVCPDFRIEECKLRFK